LLSIFVLYELIFDYDMELLWPRLMIYLIVIELINLKNYKHKSAEEPVESIEYIVVITGYTGMKLAEEEIHSF